MATYGFLTPPSGKKRTESSFKNKSRKNWEIFVVLKTLIYDELMRKREAYKSILDAIEHERLIVTSLVFSFS